MDPTLVRQGQGRATSGSEACLVCDDVDTDPQSCNMPPAQLYLLSWFEITLVLWPILGCACALIAPQQWLQEAGASSSKPFQSNFCITEMEVIS